MSCIFKTCINNVDGSCAINLSVINGKCDSCVPVTIKMYKNIKKHRKHICGCRKCVNDVNHMVVCPICGNKRCPKAEWHEYQCSGSNELNQIGSRER